MPARRFALVPVLLAAALVPVADVLFATPQAAKPRKVAFLVGVGKYDHKFTDLGTAPENDVGELAKTLTDGGFEVVTLTGTGTGANRATKANVEDRFKDVLRGGGGKPAVKDGDTVLVVLCGHGVQDKALDPATGKAEEQPFYCPVDAWPDDTKSMVPLNGLIRASEASGATTLFLVDACREVPPDVNRGTRTGIQGKKVVLPAKTAVLFSCGQGQLAHQDGTLGENKKGHGLFTYAVLKTLKSGGRVSWTRLVAGVEEAFESDEFKALLPKGKTQSPLLATGELGATEVLAAKAGGDMAKKPADGKEYTSKTTGMKFVRIPAGTFQMGSPNEEKDRSGDEELHEVTLTKDFYLGVYEVTRGQFRKFVDDSGYKTEGEADGKRGNGWDAATKAWTQDAKHTWKNTGFEQTDEHPVVLVSWNDAVAFCNWLSNKDGKEYRLPSEAEWEFACRAGSKTRYHFGDDDENLAKYGNVADTDFRTATGNDGGIKASDGFGFTAPVGKLKANAFGLYDMHGNVWEWCQDYYGKYAKVGSSRDPMQSIKQSDDRRVVRGGSWALNAGYCLAANRNSSTPDTRFDSFGFRVCVRLD